MDLKVHRARKSLVWSLTKTLRIMKITAILILSACLTASASGYSQKVTLSEKNARLDKVFNEIRKQTGYEFLYTDEMLQKSERITLELKMVDLLEALKTLFKNLPLTYSIIEKTIVVKPKKNEETKIELPPPPITVSGRVVNEKGEGVVASIIIKGTQKGTTSNTEGYFTLENVDESATLVISGVTIENEIELKVNSRTNVGNINTITKVNSLDESIVIAYGKTTQRYATGSVSKLNNERLARQTVSNPMLALSGNVTGVQVTQISGIPGGSLSVRVRGQNSIANGNEPLYVVDGMPFPSTTLNSNLGPAGTTIHPLDNINPNDIESIEVLKDAGATAIYGSRGANGVILITTKKGVSGKPKVALKWYSGLGNVTRTIPMMSVPEYLQMRREAFANDGITPNQNNAPDLLLWDTTRSTDWQDFLLDNNTTLSDVQASVTGGSAQTQFLVTGNYRKETMVFPGDFYARKLGTLMQFSHRSTDNKLSLAFTNSISQNNTRAPQVDLAGAVKLPPHAGPIYKDDGTLNWLNSQWNNPMGQLQSPFENKTFNLLSNISFGIILPANLKFTLTGGYNYIGVSDLGKIPASAIDPVYGSVSEGIYGRRTVQTIIGEPQLSWQSSFGQHNIETLVGFSVQQTNTDALYLVGRGYVSEDLMGSISAASSIRPRSEQAIRYRYTGLFSRLQYDFAKRYLVSLTMRRDGSSRYGPANRFANFGSASAAWIFSSERFASKLKGLSFGKLIVSTGNTGNDQIGDYRYMDIYRSYSSPYLGQTTFSPVQLLNPLFGWEKVSKVEAGLDLGFFNDRLIVSTHYYKNMTSNQLVGYPLPDITGFGSILKNIPAKIRNSGWEIDIQGTVLRNNKFAWSSHFTLSIPRNKLISFQGLEASSYASYYVIGQPLEIVKVFDYTGLNQNTGLYEFTDYNRDGTITSADQQFVVNGSPRYFGGLEHRFEYGQLSLVILFNFHREPYGDNALRSSSNPGSRNNQLAWVTDRWQKPGDAATYQRYSVQNSTVNSLASYHRSSTAAYTDASYIRLRNVVLNYKLPGKMIQKWEMQQFNLFVSAQNLFLITNYQGLDPETRSVTPPTRMITVGANIQF